MTEATLWFLLHTTTVLGPWKSLQYYTPHDGFTIDTSISSDDVARFNHNKVASPENDDQFMFLFIKTIVGPEKSFFQIFFIKNAHHKNFIHQRFYLQTLWFQNDLE
jgi:hypothetical protein